MKKTNRIKMITEQSQMKEIQGGNRNIAKTAHSNLDVH